MSWLETMPAIPLARGVPVIAVFAGGGWVKHFAHGPGHRGTYASSAGVRVVEHGYRVDLNEQLGFIYALGWVSRNTDGRTFGVIEHMTGRWFAGKTTDADRDELALMAREAADGMA